ncbi:cation-transporting ATPase [Microbacterium sp.]|uniref:cation-transporting ATPase n=1 Tax=Microbacterium sp. TaxID=51671 RepID=UPI003F709881
MSKLSRLVDMASKALDKKAGPSASQSSNGWSGMVRSAADALTGQPGAATGARPATTPPAAATASAPASRPGVTPPAAGSYGSAEDRAAIARYDYLMRTAEPHAVEQIHREAFERLTPAQRAQLEARMSTELAPHERPTSSSAADLARAAGRSEAMRPGRMRGLLSRAGAGAAGAAGIGLLGAVAGGAVLSAVAAPLLAQAADLGVDFGALAEGVDVDALAGGAEGLVADAGEQVSGLGEQLSGFELPGLRDLFG